MSARDVLNRFLINRGYEIVKAEHYGGQQIELDNTVIANRVAPGRKHVWLVAPPKSGSTWLSTLLRQLLGWPVVALVNGYDRREQEVDLRPMLRYAEGNIFSPQQHCRASQPTLDFIRQFRVTPIIQTRDILDSVVSFRDHLLNEGLGMPMAHVDECFLSMDEERQYDMIIDLAMPWYFNFYASWFSNENLDSGKVLFVGYEELLMDTPGTLDRILDHIGEESFKARVGGIVDTVNAGNTRKNKAVIGRGRTKLNERQRAKIKNLRQYYSHIDFSRVGC
jgi:hypothetical protein